jgi:hypothetical protein
MGARGNSVTLTVGVSNCANRVPQLSVIHVQPWTTHSTTVVRGPRTGPRMPVKKSERRVVFRDFGTRVGSTGALLALIPGSLQM